MKKSTKVKNKKVSKPFASPRKRLKKYEDGGKEVQGLKRNSDFDSVPGSNMPLAPKGDAVTMNLKSEAVPVEKQLKKLELPAGSSTKKIAGGFSSEAQKAAYIKNAKDMIAKGKTVDDLVKSRFGTKEGLAALGIKDANKVTPKKDTNKVAPKKDLPKYDNIKALELKKKGADLKKKGQDLARIGKKQANSYKGSPERTSKETKNGRIDVVINTKQSGNKQTKVVKYDKKGNKVGTYYKEAAPRLVVDSTGKKYLNSKGTLYTELDRFGNKKVTKGKNMSMDPVKKDTFSKGSIIKKISYKNPSGSVTTLDLSKKPAKFKKGGKLKTSKFR